MKKKDKYIYISFSSVKECKLIKESKSAFGTQAAIITLSNHFSGPERIAMTKLRAEAEQEDKS